MINKIFLNENDEYKGDFKNGLYEEKGIKNYDEGKKR